MKSTPQPSSRWPLIAAAGIILLGVYGFLLIRERLSVPPNARRSIEAALASGGRAYFDGKEFLSIKEFEFLLCLKAPSDPVTVELAGPSGDRRPLALRVERYFGGPLARFPVLYLLVGLLCWTLGILAFCIRQESSAARCFFRLMLAYGYTVVISGESYVLGRSWMSIVPGVLFTLSYPLTPALLLRFSQELTGIRIRRKAVVYLPAVLAGVFFGGLFLFGVLADSSPAFLLFDSAYWILRLVLIAYFVAAIAVLVRGLRRTRLEETRARTTWVLLGLFGGMAPMLFLYELPKILGRPVILTEEQTNYFFFFVPIALAIAILKYRLFDLELVVNRSLVYSMLTAVTAAVYVLVVLVIQALSTGVRGGGIGPASMVAVFVAAAVFRPAHRLIQDGVDRAFFRRRYDARQSVLAFAGSARRLSGREDLLDLFLAALESDCPVEAAGIAAAERPGETSGREPVLIRRGTPFDPAAFEAKGGGAAPIWVRSDAARTSTDVDASRDDRLAAQGFELAAPLHVESRGLLGWVVLGRKKSGQKFGAADLSFLRALIAELVPHLERVRLQEEVIYERASREKSEELNRLKTEFISSVSHELRTPMSSIQGLAELLRAGRVRSPAQREHFLDLMIAESARLSRLLHNALDFGRIEQGLMEYRFEDVVLQDLVREVVESLGPMLAEQGAAVEVRAPDPPIRIRADADAVRQALINLIDNAIKYSTGEKSAGIEILEMEGRVEIRIRDRGVGIPPEALDRIFDLFYRVPGADRPNPRGTGLGLKIVKHIADAHGWTIRVESEPGRGSLFRLIIPPA